MNVQGIQKQRWAILIAILLLVLVGMASCPAAAFAALNVSGVQSIKQSDSSKASLDWREKYGGIYSSWQQAKAFATDGAGRNYSNWLERASGFQTEAIGTTSPVSVLQALYPGGAFDHHKDSQYFVYDIAKNKKGACGIWLRNIQIYDPAAGKPVKLDCKITFLDWEDETEKSPTKHHLVVSRTSPYPGINLAGVAEIKWRWQYYRAGTTSPYTVTSNITFNDVDSLQYLAFRESMVDYQFAAPDTELSFLHQDGYYIYQDAGEIADDDAADPRQAFGIAFSGHTLDFIFGTKNAGGAVYFGQYAYNMFVPQIDPPTKRVSAGTESSQTSVRLPSRRDPITYQVEQVVSNGYAPAMYFHHFTMEDTLEDCLEIRSAKVQQNGKDCDLFTVQIQGQQVTAAAKESALKTAGFYNQTYQMVIEAVIRPGMTEEELKPWQKDGVLSIPNRGTVTIDGTPRNTEEVTVISWQPAPKKTVSDADETGVTQNTIRSRLEPYTYRITQAVPKDAGVLSRLEFSDAVEACMEIQSVKVYEEEREISERWTITTKGNQVKASAKNPGETLAGHTYTLELAVQLKQVEDAVLTAHGHFREDGRLLLFENQGQLSYQLAEGTEMAVKTNPVTTAVRLPVDLTITKQADRYEHQVGDPISYTVTIQHHTKDCDATDLVVRDTDLADFDLDLKQANVTGAADYTLEPAEGGWKLTAPKLGPDKPLQMVFAAKAKKVLNGTIPENTASVKCFGVPKKEDSETVYINSPKMQIQKQAERTKYQVGQSIDYTLEVSQANKGCFMRDVVVTDAIQTKGVKLIPGTLTVLDKQGKDITKTMEVSLQEQSFSVETKRNLAGPSESIPPKEQGVKPYQEVDLTGYLKICYTAKLAEDALFDQEVNNVAETPARLSTNGEPVKDDPNIPSGGAKTEHTAKVAGAELRITKTSDKETYAVGETGTYTLRLEQIRPDYTAKEVSIRDTFQSPGMEMEKDSLKVRYEQEDITKQCTVTFEDQQGYTVHTGQDLAYGKTMELTYRVKFTSQDLAGQKLRNVAVASSKTTEDKKTDHAVTIQEGAAQLHLKKQSDQERYQAGGSIRYTLTVSNPDTHPAKKVVIADQIQTKGVRLQADTIQVTGPDGKDITRGCKITAEEQGFHIETGRDLAKGETITVTYAAEIQDAALAGRQVDNTAAASAEDTEDTEVTHTVSVEVPATLEIQKQADAAVYQAETPISYILTVRAAGEEAARKVVIEDQIQTKGVQLKQDTIQVIGPDGKDLTEACKVTTKEQSFRIETGLDLKPEETVTVRYQAEVSEEELAGSAIENQAWTKGDNTPKAEDTHTIGARVPKVQDGGDPKGPAGRSVQTEDSFPLPLLGAVLVTAGIAGLAFAGRKKRKGNRRGTGRFGR